MDKQRYSFAEVFIRWNDESTESPPERVTIALKSRERLLADGQTGTQATTKGSQPSEWEEGGREDNEIFYYCNGYEDFVELLAFGHNAQDFRILSVLRVY
nr:MAG TPA: hypothetical protein [Caudoviricetes sp.]